MERVSPGAAALTSSSRPLALTTRARAGGQRLMLRMATRECDVAIIGAGPGGLTTAIALRQAVPGLRVEVFDKASRFDPAGEQFTRLGSPQ